MWVRLFLLAIVAALPGAVGALDLALPGNASLSGENMREPDSYLLPIGPFANGTLPTLEVEGRVLQQAWRVEAQGMTTLQVIRPLKEQLKAAGFDILLDCSGLECGGFDFRFNTRIMPSPNMFVDLFDYRFVSARKGDSAAGAEYASVIVSRSGAAGYVQVIHVTPDGAAPLQVQSSRTGVASTGWGDQPLLQILEARGHVILGDLKFLTGSAALDDGRYASLNALAAFLKSDSTLRVALVGHTDAVGALDTNIALSKRRAASVLERLVAEYGVSRAQLEAEGMGYLSPIAPNLTTKGRDANRRVEAVLLNTQ